MVPRCPVQCSPKNLVVSQRGLLSTRFSGLNLSEKGKNWSFLVRAEVESADVEVEVEAESVVDAEEKPPRQTRVKLGDIMGILNRRAVEESDKERPIPDLRTGDIVEIKLEVPENKRRLSVYKGIIISRQNAGIHTTIRIRRVIAGVGVEIVFPIVAAATMSAANHLISVHPDDLKFQFELEKQSYCDLKVTNNTEHHVAFKVKTTSPKKYFVRPNTGVMHPWDSCIIRVTLQAQREYPPDMQCKDKFLLQSTVVSQNTEVDDLPQDTFNKEGGKKLEECKLRVIYMAPHSAHDSGEAFGGNQMRRSVSFDDNQALQRLKDERDAAIRLTQQLQQDLEILKRRRNPKSVSGFSIRFALLVGLIGTAAGLLLNLLSSSPSAE
ncbi:hypothetical protein RD792_009186 [Penstemon davidsonii]|uniref:MSP domain-containing protein n=2 Tax=Penstemon TaxID=69923 RepID=A0ABR0DCQ7_9LAMI|nr:hypothetical protein RD792_009186 [Penstemon davidsonii]